MSRGRRVVEIVLVGLLAAGGAVRPGPAAAAADEKVRVLEETPFSSVADVPPAVRNECRQIGRELPNAIVRANRNVTLVKSPKELTAHHGKYLVLEITEVRAKGGGVMSGPKHLGIRGVLYENGKEIADFEGQRGSMGGTSTCGLLEKAEKALGADVGRWLERPHPHDRLGG